MDIKIKGNGDIYLNEDKDIELYEADEITHEILHKIYLMLHIRQGELVYDTGYGLSHKILWEGHGNNVDEIRNHIKNQILKYFKSEVKAIPKIELYWNAETRGLDLVLYITFNDNKSYKIGGEILINGES